MERKRWEKQEFHPRAEQKATAEAKADPVLTKQMQYIKVLEERNRVKKRLAAASKRNDRLQEREEAFVTAFNVPTRAQTNPTSSNRHTKSATSVLPTKLTSREHRLAKCKSAPSTTLNFGSGDGGGEQRVPRAKWNRPQAPMEVAVDHQDGMPLFRLTTNEDKEEEEEESYLEESFEEFEDEEQEADDTRGAATSTRELVIEDVDEVEDTTRQRDFKQTTSEDTTVDFSRTTKELFGMIQHLSRSKQRALVGVLQQFQASEQDASDVRALQSSIGDPAIWKEITTTLNATSPTNETVLVEPGELAMTTVETTEHPSVAPLQHLLQEQLQWEDKYANEIKERLEREREEKQRILKEAEARRARMMKQLEDEEKEIERLMEVKRQERLAKLKELQEEAAAELEAKTAQVQALGRNGAAETTAVQRTAEIDELLFAADAKPMASDFTKQEVKPYEILSPLVPRLKLPTQDSCAEGEIVEIRVKLLSTWSRTKAVGLTQICVYDLNGDELAVDPENLRLYDHINGRPLPQSNDMVRGLGRLFNGVAHTNSEKDMWLGRLGDSGVLLIGFEVESAPSKLCVWNYNSKAHTACTRDMEVLVGGKCVWTGSLPETYGDQDENICTWIDLLGTARKTTRTARPSRADIIDAKARGSEQKHHSQERESSSEKPNGSTPVWLTARNSSESGSLSTNRSTAGLDDWIADEKPQSGSLTSRRRQSKTTYSARSERQDDKPSFVPVEEVKPMVELPHERRQHKATESLSSWDSLEKFSKTNRSRLPQPTELEDQRTATIDRSELFEAKAKPADTRTFTTSALLTELRQGALSSSFSSSVLPPSTSRSSLVAPLPEIVSIEKPIDEDVSHVSEIPVLPSGKCLQIEILSTWGDPYYVGLNGVEIFNERGELVKFQDPSNQVTACPESINVLEENTNDPRVPKNLVDGVNFTCDDFHMWLAPFTQGEQHYVLLEMNTAISISMVRIWNYNKSRTHTCRGVREARLLLFDSMPGDSAGKVIFEGEIRQSPGLVGAESLELSNEVILFTQETEILQAIEENDATLRALSKEQEREDEEAKEILATVHRSMELRRPRTSDAGSRTIDSSPKNQESDDDEQRHVLGKDGRPMTMATRRLPGDSRLRTSIDSWIVEEPQQRSPDANVSEDSKSLGDLDGGLNSEEKLRYGRRLTLRLHSTWGDRNYIGLTQVDVLVGSRGTPIPLDISNLDATPRDLASLGYTGDPRTLDKVVDGEGTTCDDTHMWLVPLQSDAVAEVRIEFKKAQYFYGLRLWNYNKSPEDTYRGVKQLAVLLDGALISPKETGFLLRKAPGVAEFNFGQLLRFPVAESSNDSTLYTDRVRYPFNVNTYKTPIVRQDYEAPLYPQGFMFKIICWTTWGDPYYLGLNGIELYDFAGARIAEKPTIISAVPFSVSELDNSGGRQQDARVPENLVSGLDKNTWEAHDAWLAPLASSLGNPQGNIIYLGFDTPVVVSMIKFWNYAKSPDRGVKDLDIYLDDLHIFSGTLRKAPVGDTYDGRFLKVHRVTEQFGQPVLFSCSQAQVDAEKRSVSYCGTEEQDVLGINEGQVMQESRAMYRKPDPGAEGVVVDLERRPMTAVCRQ